MVVLLTIIAGHEAFFLKRVRGHNAGSHTLLDLIIKFRNTTDADYLIIVVAPDRKRRAPEATATQIPVVQVFEPFPKASRSCRSRFPLNRFVQFGHPLLSGSAPNKPAVQRIIQDGLIRAPAVWITMCVLGNIKCLARLLHIHTNRHIERFVFIGQRTIVSILYVAAGIRTIGLYINVSLNKLFVQVFYTEEAALQVDHRRKLSFLRNHLQSGDAGLLRHKCVVRTKSRCNMHNTRTIFRTYIIA